MSINNDKMQIRAGLTNYIGALIEASETSNSQAIRHIIVACLLEEAMPFLKDEEEKYDIFSCKPLFKLIINIISDRVASLEEYSNNPYVNNQIQRYKNLIEQLEEIISKVRLN